MVGDPRNPQVWFEVAQKDLERAHRRFTEGDFTYCLFHLQQCAEKTLKGYLIGQGWNLRKTHDLGLLLSELRSKGRDCSWFNDSAEVLTAEYIADRYPGFAEPPPKAGELRGLVEDTRRLFEELSGRKYAGPELLDQLPS